MSRSNIQFLDLPNEILFNIFKRLNNMDALYALFDIGQVTFDVMLQQQRFTQILNFTSETFHGEIVPFVNSKIDRFCTCILPKISHSVVSLTVESKSMERILIAGDYSNLTQLKIYNFDEEVILRCFKRKNRDDNSSYRYIFQNQIKDFVLKYKNDNDLCEKKIQEKTYPEGIHGYILRYFKKLQCLSITGHGTPLSLADSCSLAECSSLTLNKLCVTVCHFEDCFRLLDGRLKNLTMLEIIVKPGSVVPFSCVNNMNNLPNMKSLSLSMIGDFFDYEMKIVPFLRRMPNLTELTLDIYSKRLTSIIGGKQIHDDIIVHMSQLQTFNFHVTTESVLSQAIQNLTKEDVQRTFTNVKYENADCILVKNNVLVTCHVFSLPFMFDRLRCIDSTFPSITFQRVTFLELYDSTSLTFEVFVRIARCFPVLKIFHFCSLKPLLMSRNELEFDDDQQESYSAIEFPYLTSLQIYYSDPYYVQLFLTKAKIRLPHLEKLTVGYNFLVAATNNFTRKTTRNTCANVKMLHIDEINECSTELYNYFPIAAFCFDRIHNFLGDAQPNFFD